MSEKRNILVFCAYYLPGFKAGGPIRSISNIVEALSDDFEFFIVTKDRDAFDNESYPEISVNQWNEVGRAHVYYATPENLNLKIFKAILDERAYHRLYLNSFFSIRFSFFPLLLNFLRKDQSLETILAPRGEFSLGALELKSKKKALFIKVISVLGFYRKVLWQASSHFEEDEIRRITNAPADKVHVVPNIPQKFYDNNGDKSFSGVLRIIYVSRISPKKNLIFALETLKFVKCQVRFDIYGLVDDQVYWRRCKQMISSMPSNIEVVYHGSINYNEVSSLLSKSHLFFLPTKGENYGHAIVESLMSGTLVLISNTTPWRNLEKAKVGWDLPLLESRLYIEKIEELYSTLYSGTVYNNIHIHNWIKSKIDFEKILYLHKKLFNDFCR